MPIRTEAKGVRGRHHRDHADHQREAENGVHAEHERQQQGQARDAAQTGEHPNGEAHADAQHQIAEHEGLQDLPPRGAERWQRVQKNVHE